VLQSMCMSKVPYRGKPELCVISISALGTELSKVMSSIWPGAHKGAKSKGFRGNAWKDIKRMGWDNVREVKDYGNAVLGIRSLVDRGRNRWGRVRKSRGRVRM
jgi:hypothetical protein